MSIVVVGLGYVGLSNAILLARKNFVIGVDTSTRLIQDLEKGISPIEDCDIADHLKTNKLNLDVTTNLSKALAEAELVIIATPTNYDVTLHRFDTSSVESIITRVRADAPSATIVIKSTIPVGFVRRMQAFHKTDKIFFSPEFLREGKALHDNLNPSRIVIGADKSLAKHFAKLMVDSSDKSTVDVYFTGPDEAEAIKLFTNTFLAMRVSFFNELDSYALANNLNSLQIVNGVSADPRIGKYYNNPSFGYGGYCLPKDTKQLVANFNNVPQELMSSIVRSNYTRKKFIIDHIISRKPKTVGIYGLQMKSGSDNFRESAIIDILTGIRDLGIEVFIFEPKIFTAKTLGVKLVNDISHFKSKADLILANRYDNKLDDVRKKVFTRDLYGKD